MTELQKTPLAAEERNLVESFINESLKCHRSKISKIYLYGSKARGDSRKDSDIDVLVIGKVNNDDELWELWDSLTDIAFNVEYMAERQLLLSVIVVSESDWNDPGKENSTFYKSVRNEGKVLWDQKVM